MLRELQHAFRAALLAEDDHAAIAAIVSDGLAPTARLSIHRHHVMTSLTDALAATYPAVRRLVDPRFFSYAAACYIREDPPQGPCLFEYGESFPAFLAAFPPCRELVYLPDVARLEWALNVALHAEDVPGLDPAAIRAIPPADTARLLFRVHPSVTLLRSPWPVDRIWLVNQPDSDAADDVGLDGDPVALEIRRTGDRSAFRRLGPGAHALRHALFGGDRLEAATRAALGAEPELPLAEALRELFAEEVLVGLTLAPGWEEE